MAVSASALFHFTDTREKLIQILEHTFCPRYSWENYSTVVPRNDRTTPDIAIPMVSFCDIPLSQISAHTKTYGRYGLGLKKEWGVRNKINPVFYLNPGSQPANVLRRIVDQLLAAPDPKDEEGAQWLSALNLNYAEIPFYTKLYEGKFFRKGAYLPETVNFYKEREWRYVPDITAAKAAGIQIPLSWSDFEKAPDLIEKTHGIFRESFKLRFVPEDIKYVIVEKEEEILEVASELHRIKSPTFSADDITLLTTRLVSTEQMELDF